MRVSLDVDEEPFFFELLEDEFRGLRRDCFAAGEIAEAFVIGSVLLERSDGDDAVLGSHFVVDVAAAGSDVDDAGSLAGDDMSSSARVTSAVDYAVTSRAATVAEVFVFRETTGLLLRRQVVERTVVFPPDHLGTFDRVEFLEAAILFEDLGECFQLGSAFGPLPFRSAKTLFEFPLKAFEVEVLFREVVNGVVSIRLQLHIVQVQIDRGRDVAGERPGSRRPDEQVLLSGSLRV